MRWNEIAARVMRILTVGQTTEFVRFSFRIRNVVYFLDCFLCTVVLKEFVYHISNEIFRSEGSPASLGCLLFL